MATFGFKKDLLLTQIKSYFTICALFMYACRKKQKEKEREREIEREREGEREKKERKI